MNTKTGASAVSAAHSDALPAEVAWLDADGSSLTALANTELLDRELYLAKPQRTPPRYAKQRNYQGLYYFSQLSQHVWHESLLEATTLRWLDLHVEVAAIACQPFTIVFADGSRHVPDYLALLGDHRQVVYDVKPSGYVTGDIAEQFAQTRAVCEAVGWDYEVRSELSKQEQINLAYVAAFKHPLYYPGDEAIRMLLASLTEPTPLTEAAGLLQMPTLAQARSAIFHLVCIRVLKLDLAAHLNGTTLIERNTNAPR